MRHAIQGFQCNYDKIYQVIAEGSSTTNTVVNPRTALDWYENLKFSSLDRYLSPLVHTLLYNMLVIIFFILSVLLSVNH